MSLLLDALRPGTNPAAGETHGDEAEEESLDARATLELLAPKPAAADTLVLAPAIDNAPLAPAAAPAIASFRAPDAAAVREPAPAGPRSTAAALRPKRRYGVLLMAVLVLAAVGTIVKLLWPANDVVTYDQSSESPAPPAAARVQPAPVSLQEVKVPSARPADQFAFTGNAPEIDLHEAPLHEASAAPRETAPTAPAAAPRTRSPSAAHGLSTLSVKRSESDSAIFGHVRAGYQALASGNVAGAQREYQAALEIDADSIDALLGAAAAAARDGKPELAGAAYLKVLKLEPGNPDASAAVAMLAHDATATESNESHLKVLIAGEDGNRPALHAALAGVYSGDGRWSEAAQEYFAALAKDPGNPDLAYDVGASLDQNHNAAMAIDFYQQALAFARQRPAQFDPGLVEQRISKLQARAR